MTYESLLLEAEEEGLEVYEHKFNTARLKGLCVGNVITLNSSIETDAERFCILAEEIGHYYTTVGNILNQNDSINRKREKLARGWAYEKIMPLSKLIEACETGVRNRHELAEFLGVTEDFIEEALKYYKDKYGLYTECGKYAVYFEPLNVLRKLRIKKLKVKKLKIKQLKVKGMILT